VDVHELPRDVAAAARGHRGGHPGGADAVDQAQVDLVVEAPRASDDRVADDRSVSSDWRRAYHRDGVNLNLDPTWLFLSLIPSGIGFVLFVYGKKQSRMPQLVAGLVLMVYPILTPTVFSLVGVGVLVCAALWIAVRAGW
jgi:hypothetical protein